jgi:hypothetical protein
MASLGLPVPPGFTITTEVCRYVMANGVGKYPEDLGGEIDAAMARMEQALNDPDGLPGRGWYKHMIYAPGRLTGYGAKTLPGVREAIEDERWADVATYAAMIGKALTAYADRLDEGVALINGASASTRPPGAN